MRQFSYRVNNSRGERVGTVTGLGKTLKAAESSARRLVRQLAGGKSNPRKYKSPTSRRKAARAVKRLRRGSVKRLRKLFPRM